MTNSAPIHGRLILIHLKDHRLAAGMSQYDLSAKSGVSRPTIYRAEMGLTIYAASAKRLAYALCCKPEDLLHEPCVLARS